MPTATAYDSSDCRSNIVVISGGSGGGTSSTTSNIIWTAWNDNSTAANIIWTAWNDNSTAATTTAITDQIWTRTITLRADTATSITWKEWNRSYQETAEEVQARLRRQEEYRQRQIQIEGERAAARERAQQLLHSALSEEQRAELAANGHFHLTVIDSETQERRKYRIRRGRSGNVERVDENGKRLADYCIHPRIACPDEDTMLAQKLMLECGQEREFLQIANARHYN